MNKLLVFTASWCAPCNNIRVILNKLKTIENIIIYDVDSNRELTDKYKVGAVPTFIVLDSNGKEINRHVGPLAESSIINLLNE